MLECSTFENEARAVLSKNFAGFIIPGNADIREIDVYFVDEKVRAPPPLGATVIGELGASEYHLP